MLNEDKIKLMTSISMFEKKEGRYLTPVKRYFKGDYIGRHMLRSCMGYTFCWLLGVALLLVYNAQEIFAMMNLDAVREYGVWFLVSYIGGLFIYQLITAIVYARRYAHGVRGMKVYVARLKRLEKRYEFQNRTKELGRR